MKHVLSFFRGTVLLGRVLVLVGLLITLLVPLLFFGGCAVLVLF